MARLFGHARSIPLSYLPFKATFDISTFSCMSSLSMSILSLALALSFVPLVHLAGCILDLSLIRKLKVKPSNALSNLFDLP